MEKEIKDLGLSQRACTVLIQGGLTNVGAIMNYGIEKVWQLKGCGSFTHKEIKRAVLKDMPKNN
jgi:hypothetical protein